MTAERKPPEGRRDSRRNTSRYDKRQRAAAWGFLTPSLAGVFVFFVAPFFVVAYYAVINNVIQRRFVGAENFAKVLGNRAFQEASFNTLRFSAVAVPLAVALSLFLAVLLLSRIPGRSLFRTFFLSPLMVPVASVVLIWQILFNYNGLANQITALFGADKIDWLKSPHAQVVIVLLFLWKNLGYNMILFMAGLAAVPEELMEVARLEGAGEAWIFFRLKLRYLAPTIAFVTIMSLVNSFKVFREVYLLTGDYPYDALYMLQHFMNNTFQSLDYQRLSAAAILMGLFMVALIALLLSVEAYFAKDLEESE